MQNDLGPWEAKAASMETASSGEPTGVAVGRLAGRKEEVKAVSEASEGVAGAAGERVDSQYMGHMLDIGGRLLRLPIDWRGHGTASESR